MSFDRFLSNAIERHRIPSGIRPGGNFDVEVGSIRSNKKAPRLFHSPTSPASGIRPIPRQNIERATEHQHCTNSYALQL